MLSDSNGNILDDEELINTLQVSQSECLEIEEKLEQLEMYYYNHTEIGRNSRTCKTYSKMSQGEHQTYILL